MQPVCREPAREVPIVAEVDVLVVGGGIAGVAAAVAARRSGVSVALLEKSYALGGLATLANVMIYLPLCDGRGRQVIGGLAEELLHRSVAHVTGPDRDRRLAPAPVCWRPGGDPEERTRQRYQAEFNPAALLLELEALCLGEGVDLWYDTRFCGVVRGGDGIEAVLVENKSGRLALRPGCVIDATGDADVCAAAGETTESLAANVLCGWFYYLEAGRLRARMHHRRYSPSSDPAEAEGPLFRGDDGRDVSAQVIATRAWLREWLAEHPEAEPIVHSTMPGLRMTRRLRAAVELREADDHRWFDDAVCLTGDWRRRGPVFCVPLRALRGVANRNLLAVGRCLSADRSIWDATRAIPTCAATGEAAGIAAAAARGNVHAVDIAAVQAELRARGGILDPALLAPA